MISSGGRYSTDNSAGSNTSIDKSSENSNKAESKHEEAGKTTNSAIIDGRLATPGKSSGKPSASQAEEGAGGKSGGLLSDLASALPGQFGISGQRKEDFSTSDARSLVNTAGNKDGTSSKEQVAAAKRVLSEVANSDTFTGGESGSREAVKRIAESRSSSADTSRNSSADVKDSSSAGYQNSSSTSGNLGVNSDGILGRRGLEIALDKAPGQNISVPEAQKLMNTLRTDADKGMAIMQKINAGLQQETSGAIAGASPQVSGSTPGMSAVRASGNQAVEDKARQGQVNVNAAGNANQGAVEGARQGMGAPAATSMPDGAALQKNYEAMKDSTGQAVYGATGAMATAAGAANLRNDFLAYNLQRSSTGVAGMSLGGGAPAQQYTPKQVDAAIQSLVQRGAEAFSNPNAPDRREMSNFAMSVANYQTLDAGSKSRMNDMVQKELQQSSAVGSSPGVPAK